MAAFRILYFPPATSHFSHTHLFLHSPPPPPHRRLLSLATKPQRSILQLFLVKDNARARAEAQAQSTIQSESAEENIAEEDGVSKTRLLVQNVPWTCTVDDLRPLFENYGSVVDIEVGLPFCFIPIGIFFYGFFFFLLGS